MLSPARLFLVLNELVFVSLGALLVWVALTGRYFFDRRAWTWIGLGAVLIYWGLRTVVKAGSRPLTVGRSDRATSGVRGASLALVGLMMLGIAWLPFAWVAPLLGGAGAILIARGMLSAVLALRMP